MQKCNNYNKRLSAFFEKKHNSLLNINKLAMNKKLFSKFNFHSLNVFVGVSAFV
jgi:hypothetical protein